MGFFVKDENLIGGVEIIIGETANLTNEKKLKGLRIYLRNETEATTSSTADISMNHGPSFKVFEGSKNLTEVYMSKKGNIEIPHEKNLPIGVARYIKKFAANNFELIKELWITDRSDQNYEKILKKIEDNNPNCKIKINKK